MEEQLDRIEGKLDAVLRILTDDVQGSCDKMAAHIDFVETVYEDVKNPLGYVCKKINYLSKDTNGKEIEDAV